MFSTNLVAGGLVPVGLVGALPLPNTAPGDRVVWIALKSAPTRDPVLGNAGDDAYHSLDLGSLT